MTDNICPATASKDHLCKGIAQPECGGTTNTVQPKLGSRKELHLVQLSLHHHVLFAFAWICKQGMCLVACQREYAVGSTN